MKQQVASDVLSVEEEQVLRDAVSSTTIIAAVSAGVVFGLLNFSITVLPRLRLGPNAESATTNLIMSIPRFRDSYSGEWIGMAWGFIYGAVIGTFLYAAYARTLRGRTAVNLGYRLRVAGVRFQRDKCLKSSPQKEWRFRNLVPTSGFHRAIF